MFPRWQCLCIGINVYILNDAAVRLLGVIYGSHFSIMIDILWLVYDVFQRHLPIHPFKTESMDTCTSVNHLVCLRRKSLNALYEGNHVERRSKHRKFEVYHQQLDI